MLSLQNAESALRNLMKVLCGVAVLCVCVEVTGRNTGYWSEPNECSVRKLIFFAML